MLRLGWGWGWRWELPLVLAERESAGEGKRSSQNVVRNIVTVLRQHDSVCRESRDLFRRMDACAVHTQTRAAEYCAVVDTP